MGITQLARRGLLLIRGKLSRRCTTRTQNRIVLPSRSGVNSEEYGWYSNWHRHPARRAEGCAPMSNLGHALLWHSLPQSAQALIAVANIRVMIAFHMPDYAASHINIAHLPRVMSEPIVSPLLLVGPHRRMWRVFTQPAQKKPRHRPSSPPR